MASLSKIASSYQSHYGKTYSGYRNNVVRQPLDKKYLCRHCGCLLRIPVQTGCGERFCRACCDALLAEPEPRCPVCKEELSQKQVFRDMFAERETLSLEVYCENKERGCDWKGILKEYDGHIPQCVYQLVSCPNGCGQMVVKLDVARHGKDDCNRRQVKCHFCKKLFSANEIDEHTQADCPHRPSVCPHCQQVTLPHGELKVHIANACAQAPVKCQYAMYGCQEELPRHLQPSHYVENMPEHLRMVEASHATLHAQVDRMETKLMELANKLDSTLGSGDTGVGMRQTTGQDGFYRNTDTMMGHEQQRHFMAGTGGAAAAARTAGGGRKAASHGHATPGTVTEMARQALDVAQRNAEHLKEQEVVIGGVKQTVADHTRQMAVQDVQTADMNLRMDIIDVKTTNGVLIWKIGDISRRRREAVSGKTPSLYSAPFYTSPCAYKMCARIYLDGDGVGKGSCISIFFVLMRGEYDALLPWPFQQRVTMMLMDQSESTSSRRNIVEVFKPDLRSNSFRRPRAEMNTGSGCPMFAPINVLDSPNYVQDDTIFIKMIVEKSSSHFVAPDSERA